MPLFRFHKGELEESLATTIIVKSEDELKNIIIKRYFLNNAQSPLSAKKAKLKIQPYPSEESCFDKRIGWYTQIVGIGRLGKETYNVIGFLSEPF